MNSQARNKNTRGIGRRSFLEKGALAASLLVGRPLLSAAPESETPGPIVQTTAGKIRGATQAKVSIFRGVPYGASTAGANRFMPPVKPQPWTGVRDALVLGQMAAQHPGNQIPEIIVQRPKDEAMGEDCLVLNVWTGHLGPSQKRPVMVWLHGGGFSYGSGGSTYFDGTNLAARHDAVVVTLNCRLNIFGFLYLADAGGAKYASSGNSGMLDIVAALEWVRDNIAAFGGDPGNVTVIGQSSGGGAVSTLMAMPAAKGLFHRAVIQSGTTIVKGIPRDRAARSAQAFLDKLGVKPGQVDQLQSLSMEQLLAAMQGVRLGLGPVVDGVALPTDPFDPAAPETSAGVPLLIGSLATEISANNNAPLDPMDEATLHARVKQYVRANDAETDNLIAVYRKARPGVANTDLYLQIASDSWVRMASMTVADRKTAQKAPVYMYYFSWNTPVHEGKLRSPHTLEIAFMFDNVELGKPLTGTGPQQDALAARMSGAWAAFARSGNPSHKGLPNWPAYTTDRRATMVFDNECKVANDPDREERQAMSAIRPA